MTVKSTMSGSVWKVRVDRGDLVNIGDAVLILESMKMEIPIEAEKAGKVKDIHVKEGDFVQEGDVVVTFESL